jgi:hypothetical protein
MLAVKYFWKIPLERRRCISEDTSLSKWTLKKYDKKVWTGFIWLRIVYSGGPL